MAMRAPQERRRSHKLERRGLHLRRHGTIVGTTPNDPAVMITGSAPFSIDILGVVVYSGNLTANATERLT